MKELNVVQSKSVRGGLGWDENDNWVELLEV